LWQQLPQLFVLESLYETASVISYMTQKVVMIQKNYAKNSDFS